MRRLLRRAFNVSAAVSAALCVGVCVLGVRSLYRADVFFLRKPAGRDAQGFEYYRGLYLSTEAGSGLCYFGPGYYRTDDRGYFDWDTQRVTKHWSPVEHGDSLWRRLGFGHLSFGGLCCVGFPLWAPALMTFVPCALWLTLRIRRRRRHRPGTCPSCGYDLRATPEEGGALLARCPECGAMPAKGGEA